jgi:dTDP-4-amino-4,6-dideoxygalactose transaminase
MRVPFVDLRRQYETLKNEIDTAIQKVIQETAFIKGRYVNAFESEYAGLYGVQHCIGVANGTDAIYIALKCLGIGPGDEVITTAHSWISTSEVITLTGAKPVFVDVDRFYHIDTSKIREKISSRTKAILPVHLFGQPVEIDAVRTLCNEHGLMLVEDCAQAHFAEYRGQKVGTFGIAGTFSFYPGKNLGAYGDAGAIITNDDALASKIRMYADHGALKKHVHEIEGINSRLDGLQAAVLTVKLKHIHRWNRARYDNAMRYNALLGKIPSVKVPAVRENSTHIFHLYVIQAEERDGLIQHLSNMEVETGIHYPTALPFLPAYRYLGHVPGDFPAAYANQSRILSLPMFPELTEEQIRFVADAVAAYYQKRP